MYAPDITNEFSIAALVIRLNVHDEDNLYSLLNSDLEDRYRELLQDAEDGLEQVDLLAFSTDISDDVFDALSTASEDGAAGHFDDNGGDPDGAGPYMSEIGNFSESEIEAAKSAGATVERGYKFPYPHQVDEHWEFCGYQCNGEAFALDRQVALDVKKLSEQFAYRLHLLETQHGTRFWRWNDEDSDDSRGENHVATIACAADEYESIGEMWQSGTGVKECADVAGDLDVVREWEYLESLRNAQGSGA